MAQSENDACNLRQSKKCDFTFLVFNGLQPSKTTIHPYITRGSVLNQRFLNRYSGIIRDRSAFIFGSLQESLSIGMLRVIEYSDRVPLLDNPSLVHHDDLM